MSGRILIINPNSNPEVTHAMAEAVAGLGLADGPALECITMAEGPFGIESQADVEAVTLPLRRIVAKDNESDAFVIGCFSDPGLAVCREVTSRPVLGIRECAVMAALMQGDSFGVVAIGPSSVKRQARAFREMGVADRWVGSAPLGMSVAEAESEAAYPAVRAAAEKLRGEGADTIVLGCSGMARHRKPLAADLNAPVIDPTQSAAAMALGLVLLNR